MEMFSRKETAKILGISLKTLDALREDKRIGYYQVRPGCKVQFTQTQIDKYLKKSERGMKTPQYRIIASESLCRMGNLVFTQGLPIFTPFMMRFFTPLFPPQKQWLIFARPQHIVVDFLENQTPQIQVSEQQIKKNPGSRVVPGFLATFDKVQRLENCGARRAAFRPYFNRLSDDFP